MSNSVVVGGGSGDGDGGRRPSPLRKQATAEELMARLHGAVEAVARGGARDNGLVQQLVAELRERGNSLDGLDEEGRTAVYIAAEGTAPSSPCPPLPILSTPAGADWRAFELALVARVRFEPCVVPRS